MSPKPDSVNPSVESNVCGLTEVQHAASKQTKVRKLSIRAGVVYEIGWEN
ncbi:MULTISPECIES: hypothetical protein [Paenibacillus]|uniref:Uncharacterized protein n=1 Tax=Paenibacillus brasilensis TaxID=128574 RepID=A0ABU0KX67_9BACL|nr:MULTISPECIES: hypothetical protein [Paenibacillus]MDQ0492986.1 hypothetical protein [Paenibacillus brasilensis]